MTIKKRQKFNPFSNNLDYILNDNDIQTELDNKQDKVLNNLSAIIDPTVNDDDTE
jgi:hypothetical protein